MEMDERKLRILQAIIDDYITTACPSVRVQFPKVRHRRIELGNHPQRDERPGRAYTRSRVTRRRDACPRSKRTGYMWRNCCTARRSCHRTQWNSCCIILTAVPARWRMSFAARRKPFRRDALYGRRYRTAGGSPARAAYPIRPCVGGRGADGAGDGCGHCAG